jgi:hypothetical protein
MTKNLNALWFIHDEPDFEREQWKLLAFIRDANIDVQNNKLLPYYITIKYMLQDLECFLSTRAIVSILTPEEELRLATFNNRSDVSTINKEVFKIVKWAMLQLQDLQKLFTNLWRHVESSFNIFYMGVKPPVVINGMLLINYANSIITECYNFWTESEKIWLAHIEYTEDSYTKIKERFENDYSVFIVAESLVAFDTTNTTLPYMAEVLEKKVITQ